MFPDAFCTTSGIDADHVYIDMNAVLRLFIILLLLLLLLKYYYHIITHPTIILLLLLFL